MLACPRCRKRLARVKGEGGVFWSCPHGHGRAVGLGLLRRAVTRDAVSRLWQAANENRGRQGARCPACARRMRLTDLAVEAPGGPASVQLDVCAACHFVWFDPQELERLPAKRPPPKADKKLPPEAAEAFAIREVERIKRRRETGEDEPEAPAEAWKYLPALLGMPIEYGMSVAARPWATWLLAAAVTAVSLASFGDLAGAVRVYGLVPNAWARDGGLTLATSFFLHAGWLHLLGNMYFLLVFGDNVEDYLGRKRFLLLLLVATLAGNAVHVLFDPRRDVACIGASGGISGVITFYALAFPMARLGLLPWFWIIFGFRWFRIPAIGALLLWVVLQVVGAFQQVAGMTNVSSLAHLGGAAVGLVCWMLWKRAPGEQRVARSRDRYSRRPS